MGVLNGNGSSNGTTTTTSSNGHQAYTNGGASYSEKALLNSMGKQLAGCF